MAKKNAENIGKVLFTQQQIEKRAKELGAQIDKDYAGEDVLLLGTLKGSIMWMADMMKAITLDTPIDFITASSYGSSTMSSGVVKITYEPTSNLYGKNVLIVEDIVDTGNTLQFLIEKLKEHGPKSVKVCTLLNKKARRTTDFEPDYIGFEVDDLFIIGYGLDYDQHYRGLPYVGYLTEEDVEAISAKK